MSCNGIALLLRIWPGTQIRPELGAGQQVHIMGLNFKWSQKTHWNKFKIWRSLTQVAQVTNDSHKCKKVNWVTALNR